MKLFGLVPVKWMEEKFAFACMDFQFIGGSMGSVVGEKIARMVDKAYKSKIPLIIISESGGARDDGSRLLINAAC